MAENILEKDIKFLPGVGPKRAELLKKELAITNYGNLITYYPYKYIDRSKIHQIRDLNSQMTHVQLKGKILSFGHAGVGRKQRLTALFSDGTGNVELVWFRGIKWVQNSYKVGVEYVLFGKPSIFKNKYNIVHPELELAAKHENTIGNTIQGQYSVTEKLKSSYINSKTILGLQHTLLQVLRGKLEETLPDDILGKNNLIGLSEAYKNIHFPESQDLLRKAQLRLKFEELFFIQLSLLRLKVNTRNTFKGFVFKKVGDKLNTFYAEKLPFELTHAQKRVVKEIRRDMGSGIQMNRLLQGDVGSGKTLVALMIMLIALDNGYQACLMAPTEILAAQHFKTISSMLFGINVNVKLLTGSTKQKARDEIHQELKGGHLEIIVGTHAIIEDPVIFKNLGIVVIDEQHRFGVAQRAKLWKKNVQPPHVLVMTATPIPRTLAMTVYGDLDVSVIDELPPGRKPVKTYHYYDNKRLAMFGFLKKQIAEGRQVYMVYPLIKESEKMDYKDLEDGYESIVRAFPEHNVCVVHGKMKPEEKEKAMQLFKSGHANIMVATTVIEVGVDVPNASVMVIESAERFGLSQLHQLRGRVGRGADQAFCILMSSYKLSKEAKQRIDTMVRTNDGFEIAEADMKLRGPGDIEGTQQSGIAFDMKIANLAKDGQLIQLARNNAEEVLDDDPALEKNSNIPLKKNLIRTRREILDWSIIS
jgi:ATP-dependent DNA helicase RecG